MTRPMEPDDSRSEDGSEHAKVLAEVLDDQKRRKEARDKREPRSSGESSFYVQVALLVSATFFFYLLFFSPTWIAPAPAAEITVEREEDNLRFYLFMLARQVDAFRSEQGRLPATVEEIPGVKPGTEYVRLSPRDYRIRFSAGPVSVTYESSQDPDEFLGDAEGSVLGTGTAGSAGDAP